MSYTIIKTNGTVLTTITDGTLNTTSTSIALPGRLYPGYGQVIDTDLVHVLENFADVSPPANPLQGQLWFNTGTNTLCICPTDGETNALAWYTVITQNSTLDITAGNITAAGNINANNFNATNNVVANLANVNYLQVNVDANIAKANITGNIVAANLTGNHFGNGAGLSAITGANVTGAVANANAANTVLANTSTSTTAYPTFVISGSNGWSQHYINSGISANLGNASITATTFVGALSGTATSATTAGTVTTAAQLNITSVGTLTSLAVTGNITAGNVYANSGTIGASLLTGTLTTAAQPNITSVGTLTSLGVSGTVTASRFVSNVATGTAPFTVASTTKVTNLNADYLNGYQTDIGNTASTVALRDTGGNISANYFIGNGALLTGISTAVSNVSNGTSNLNIPTAGGNINISVGGVANTIVANGTGLTVTGNITAGNISVTGITGSLITATQPNITSLGTLSTLNVSGNITGANVIGNIYGNGASLTNLPAANISGTVNFANYSTYAGAIINGPQPNITGVGTLTSLAVSGKVTAGQLQGDGGNISNIRAGNVVGSVANAAYADNAGVAATATNATNATYAATAGTASSATYATTAGAVNSLTGTQVNNALGYVPYNSSNPSNFISLASFTQNFNQGGTAGLIYGGTNYGWTQLPNGLIIQWGNNETFHSGEGTVAVTFPVTFPNMVLTVVAVDKGQGYGNTGDDMWVQVPYIYNSGCYIMYQSGSSGNSGYGYRWIAIGY